MRSLIRPKTPESPALAWSLDLSSTMKLTIPEMTSATAMARSPLIGVTTWMISQTASSKASLSPV